MSSSLPVRPFLLCRILRKLLRNVTYAYMQKMQLFVFKICALWLNLLSFYHFTILFYYFGSILFNETVVYIVIIFLKSFFFFLCGYDHCILYIEYYRLLICVKDSCHCSLSYSGKCLYKLYLFVYQICLVSYNFQVFFFLYLTWLTLQSILLKNNILYFLYIYFDNKSHIVIITVIW